MVQALDSQSRGPVFKIRSTLKNCLFPITRITKKKSPGQLVKLFFTLFKLNITLYFKCYLHHNCSVNLNWNNTQLYSSTKTLHNVPSSVFWLVNFCFLPFLCRTSIQKWKEKLFCYVHKWIGKKNASNDIKVPVSNHIQRSCSTNQSCVQRSQNPHIFEKVYYFAFKFLDSKHKISIVLWLP